jgi:23S rRNA pseudouridine1911/1915/1917 synthase
VPTRPRRIPPSSAAARPVPPALETVRAPEPADDAEEQILSEPGEDGVEHLRWKLRRSLPGRRLDKYIADRLHRFSRTTITGLIREGHITVDGRKVKPSHEPGQGQTVELKLPPTPEIDIRPEPMPLDVVFEDEHLIVLNKQAGAAVHPARGTWTGTLINGLLAYAGRLSGHHGDPFRPGVVHRLDKNTTGLIVFAKTEEAHWRLAVQWENRTVEKEYRAIVEGRPRLKSDWIDVPIGKHPTVREKYAARPEIGKPALTYYETLEAFDDFALLRCDIHTGRTHQIRVHLSYIGRPVVADDMYGRRTELWLSDVAGDRGGECGVVQDEVLIKRQALHAARLKFRHPLENRWMELEAPLPADMARLLAELRRRKACSSEAGGGSRKAEG